MSDPARERLERWLTEERDRADPPESVVQRVWEGVEGRLDGRIPAPAWTASSPSLSWAWWLAGIAAVAAVVGLALGADTSATPMEPITARARVEPGAVVSPPDLRSPVSARAEPQPAVEPAEPTTRAPTRTHGTFAEELALVERARRALRRRQFGEVLSTVREHRRRFPTGALVEEAAALHLAASCGRNGDRDHTGEIADFTRRWSRSVHADLIDLHCH
jgi:hypothetical protein